MRFSCGVSGLLVESILQNVAGDLYSVAEALLGEDVADVILDRPDAYAKLGRYILIAEPSGYCLYDAALGLRQLLCR